MLVKDMLAKLKSEVRQALNRESDAHKGSLVPGNSMQRNAMQCNVSATDLHVERPMWSPRTTCKMVH